MTNIIKLLQKYTETKDELDPENRTSEHINPLYSLIQSSFREKFEDKNFTELDTETLRTISLSELYDY